MDKTSADVPGLTAAERDGFRKRVRAVLVADRDLHEQQAQRDRVSYAELDEAMVAFEDWVVRLRAEATTPQTEALRWLVNLACGVGKAGGKPEEWEIEEAVVAGKAALRAAAPTEDR